jgi:hypothetical protein
MEKGTVSFGCARFVASESAGGLRRPLPIPHIGLC